MPDKSTLLLVTILASQLVGKKIAETGLFRQ